MLTELKVSQFAIIDHIHIHFKDGLNILSGETGAGKSILIKSLALLMGAKSSSQDIRSSEELATIEGAFELSHRKDILEKLKEMGIDSSEESLIVRRQLHKNGKSKVYLNGSLSTVVDLKRIVFPLVTLSNPTDAPLIEITGQHENKDLMSPRYQMDVLDQFCGNLELREQTALVFSKIKGLQEQINDLESLSQQREQQIDFLEFQLKEIDTLGLQEREDEILKNKISQLKQKGQWQAWIQASQDTISNSDRSILSRIKTIINQAPVHNTLTSIVNQLNQCYSQLEDIAYELQTLDSQDLASEESLDDLEDRLSRIRKLQKKFGADVAEILHAYDSMTTEYKKLTNLTDTVKQLKKEKEKEETNLFDLCEILTNKRKKGATLLSKKVNHELKDLNMKGLEFLVAIENLENPNSSGSNKVIFQTKTGKKDEARELSKAASGGELSRILLSLKQVVGVQQNPRTFLFDEVDTGVSGPTAEKVGAKLKNLAQHQQVICVTHLPQVACFGDHHYYIEKQPTKNTVEMTVTHLDEKARINEIARLISGEKVTQTSIAHAKQLLNIL